VIGGASNSTLSASDGRTVDLQSTADVSIVGAGASGAAVAWSLAELILVEFSRQPDGALVRSGVKHLIDSGVDPHTVMAFSGHRTPSMLRRYHIIDLDDLRRAAERSTQHRGAAAIVTPLRERTATQQP